MSLRTLSSVLIAVTLGVCVAALSYAILLQAETENEQRYVKESIDRRTGAIEEAIWTSIRQLDLLVAYYEATSAVDSASLSKFLTSVWTANRNKKALSNLPVAMGWIDISRARGDSLVAYDDGFSRTIDVSSDLGKILDEMSVRSNNSNRLSLYRGRVDTGRLDAGDGSFYSIMEPVFGATPFGRRILLGFAFAVVDLKDLIVDTAEAPESTPLVRVYFDTGGHEATQRRSKENLIIDETEIPLSSGAVMMTDPKPLARHIAVARQELHLEFFRDKNWSYMRAAPFDVLREKSMKTAAACGLMVTLVLLLIGFYRARQHRMLKELADKASEAAQARTEFRATMSHEIRTPMNGIFGMTELLGNTDLTEQQRKYVDTVLFSAEVLLMIIDDVLDFAKLDVGKMELEPIPTDLAVTLNEVTNLLSTKARDKAVELLLDIKPGTPEVLVIDPGRFKQVIMNLLGNALKFTEEGHVVVTARCVEKPELREDHVLLRIAVTDTGVDIPPENLGKIFERFTQNDASTSRKFGRTGLGLSICRQIVDLMGGEIGVDSEEGKGSTFWFEIPVQVGSGQVQRSQQDMELRDRNILVVDDNAFARELVQQVLKNVGAVVHTCASGEEAIALLSAAEQCNRQFDLALIDYQMPGMKGDELAHTIRSNPDYDSLPLVRISALSRRHIDADQTADAFDGAITKPFSPIGLVRQIVQILKRGLEEGHCLPDQKGAQKDTTAVAASRPAADNDNILSGRKILVAEDSAVNQAYVNETLQQFGCIVTIASNGEEALRMAQASEFDVMLIDCHMPIMDGFESAATITRLMDDGVIQRTPILAFTADAAGDNVNKCASVGMLEQLSKPIRQDVLRDTLERWVRHADQRRGRTTPAESFDAAMPTTALPQRAAPQQISPSAPTIPPSRHSTVASAVTDQAPAAVVTNPNSSAAEPSSEATANAPASADSGSAMIDEAVFQQGQALFGDDFWPLIDRFVEDAASHLTVVEASMQAQDFAEIHRPAHSLKSSSRQIGAFHLGNVAAKIEQCVHPGQEVDQDSLAPAIQELREAMAATREALDVIRRSATD